MRQRDLLVGGGEDQRVLADDLAAAQGGEPDGARAGARPVWPCRPLSMTSSSAIPRPRATARPMPMAVPEGASTFWRWCISTISAS